MKGLVNLIRSLSNIKIRYGQNNLKIATTLRRLWLAYLSEIKWDSHNLEETDNIENYHTIECLGEALSVFMGHGYGGTEEHDVVLFDKGVFSCRQRGDWFSATVILGYLFIL